MTEPTNIAQRELSNTCVVRDLNGKLSIWVGGTRVIGTQGIATHPQADGTSLLTFGISSFNFRFAEQEPIAPVYEKNNVLAFPNMAKALAILDGGKATPPDVVA